MKLLYDYIDDSEQDELLLVMKHFSLEKNRRQKLMLGLETQNKKFYKTFIGGKDLYSPIKSWEICPYALSIMERINKEFSKNFNICAIMFYPPSKGINPHKDKECDSEIFGLSIGSERKMVVSGKEYRVKDKSLYIMKKHDVHCVLPGDFLEYLLLLESINFRTFLCIYFSTQKFLHAQK